MVQPYVFAIPLPALSVVYPHLAKSTQPNLPPEIRTLSW